MAIRTGDIDDLFQATVIGRIIRQRVVPFRTCELKLKIGEGVQRKGLNGRLCPIERQVRARRRKPHRLRPDLVVAAWQGWEYVLALVVRVDRRGECLIGSSRGDRNTVQWFPAGIKDRSHQRGRRRRSTGACGSPGSLTCHTCHTGNDGHSDARYKCQRVSPHESSSLLRRRFRGWRFGQLLRRGLLVRRYALQKRDELIDLFRLQGISKTRHSEGAGGDELANGCFALRTYGFGIKPGTQRPVRGRAYTIMTVGASLHPQRTAFQRIFRQLRLCQQQPLVVYALRNGKFICAPILSRNPGLYHHPTQGDDRKRSPCLSSHRLPLSVAAVYDRRLYSNLRDRRRS